MSHVDAPSTDLEMQVRLGQERIAFLEEQVELLRKENNEFLAMAEKPSVHKYGNVVGNSVEATHFQLVTLTDGLPLVIDPRDTVAKRFCSKRMCELLWTLFRNKVIALTCLGMTLVAIVGGILSIVGDYPVLGYLTVLCLAQEVLVGLHMNVPRLVAVVKSFQFISVVLLTSITWIGIADAVMMPNEGFGRPFVAIMNILLLPSAVLFAECGSPTKSKIIAKFLTTLSFSILYWTMVCLWYTGCWVNVKQTIFPLGSVSVDVQSVSMSAMVTLAVLFSKFAWSSFWSKETNAGVISHAKIAYRPVPAVMAVSPVRSLTVVNTLGDDA